jgi:cell division protein FtsI/penicillin-binding protein 2
MKHNKFKFRAVILLAVITLWGIAAFAGLLYYAILARDKYLHLGNKLALREGTFYPVRSRILDRNGIVLAWSVKYFDLYLLDPSGNKNLLKRTFKKVKAIIPDADLEPDRDAMYLLRKNISPHQIVALENLLARQLSLQIITRIERKTVDYPKVRRLLGKVKYYEGRQCGISGFEKLYDEELTGTPGKYKVMLDRSKTWIKGTWELTQRAVPGKDVKLKKSIAEMRGDTKK